jgi:hypothetical protein
MLRGQRLQPPPLFQADRLLAALRAIQYLVYPEPSPPMSRDFVAFFNHLLSRTCSEVVARVVSGAAGTFKAAVEALFDGELVKHAVKEGETWTVDKGPPQVVALFEDVGGQWPTWLKPQLCGLADYVMAEILEVSTMAFRDGQRCSQGSACSKLCRQDARLLFQLTKEARNAATSAAPEAVRSLLQWRYQPFPLIVMGSAISQDNELVSLCKKMLGEELGQDIHLPKQPQPQRPTASATVTSNSAEYRTHSKRWLGEDNELAWLSNGVGIRPMPLNKAFPDPQQVGVFKSFCLEYGAVDQNALREEDQPAVDGDGFENLRPDVLETCKSQLDTVRRATRGESGVGAAVELNLEEDYQQGGCDLLQLLGAVAFQLAAGNISKVSCVWPSVDDAMELADLVEDLLGDTLDPACIPELWDEVTVTMYGESFTESYDGSTQLHRLAYMNNVRHLRKFGAEATVEDSISGDCGGLHDEDSQGEYKPLHVAAHEGNLEAFCVLADELGANVNSSAFDGATPLLVAVSTGQLAIAEACVERRAELSTQVVAEPGRMEQY